MTIAEQVGQRLKEMRKNKGLTQTQAGQAIEKRQPHYARFESGEHELNYEQIIMLCKLFDCSSDYLLGLSNI